MAKQVEQLSSGYTFYPRTSVPAQGNKYYNTVASGGYNGSTIGNYNPASANGVANRKGWTGLTCLPNCTGYAVGRFNEIGGRKNCNYPFNGGGTPNACDFIKWANGVSTGTVPRLGAIIVWSGGKSGCGHVAVVEKILAKDQIVISHSGWSIGLKNQVWLGTNTITCGYDGNWTEGVSWLHDNGYYFKGFIYNPYVPYSGVTTGGSVTELEADLLKDSNNKNPSTVYTPKTVTRTSFNHNVAKLDTETGFTDVRGTSLLTYPSLIETPFISVKIGDVTFGVYNKTEGYSNNTKIWKVTYPNFVNSLEVTKVNGTVNQYTINLIYQIQAGEDPNLIEKIFSRSGYSNIYITYGDYSSPTFIYKEEEALITKVTSRVDFGSARITYTISATSNANSLSKSLHTYSGTQKNQPKKPSDLIMAALENSSNRLQEVFPGMYSGNKLNKTAILANHLIATDDCECTIQTKSNIDIVSYLNYLVSCMTCVSDKGKVIKDSYYTMVLCDDINNEYGGTYFKVVKTSVGSGVVQSLDTYSVDIGYPGETPVVQFNVSSDNLWSILYNYSEQVDQDDYIYKISDNGEIYSEYAPNLTRSSTLYKTTESAKSWWTKLTQFPVTAELTIKGLVKPAMLMTYVKINAFFYGRRHISSGLYVITKQQDRVDAGGYRTTLTLLRTGGDDEYIESLSYSTENKTIYVPSTEIKATDINTTTVPTSDTTNTNKQNTYVPKSNNVFTNNNVQNDIVGTSTNNKTIKDVPSAQPGGFLVSPSALNTIMNYTSTSKNNNTTQKGGFSGGGGYGGGADRGI